MTDIYYSRIPNPDYNTLITQYANNYEKHHKQGLSRLHKSMLKYVHNLLHYQKGFKRSDLKQFYTPKITTKDGFDDWIGQFISKMKKANIIYDLNSNRPKTYSLRGIHLDSITEQDTASITSENELIDIVRKIMLTEKPQFHNISASFWLSDESLYQKLERMYHEQITGIDFNKSNKQITCKLDKPLGLSRTATFLVYPNKRVDIRLRCTDNPFDFNHSGIGNCIGVLSTALTHLKFKTVVDFVSEEISEWKIQTIDLNHDTSFTDLTNSIRTKHLFRISARIDSITDGKIKVYPHKNKDTGETKTRVEYPSMSPKDMTLTELMELSEEYEQDIERENEKEQERIRKNEELTIQMLLHDMGETHEQFARHKQQQISYCSKSFPTVECICGYHKF